MGATMLAGRLTLDAHGYAAEEVAVRAAGVCLSDVHLIDGSSTPPFNTRPVVKLGRETAGVIAEVGPGVVGWQVGRRVALQAGQSVGVRGAGGLGRTGSA